MFHETYLVHCLQHQSRKQQPYRQALSYLMFVRIVTLPYSRLALYRHSHRRWQQHSVALGRHKVHPANRSDDTLHHALASMLSTQEALQRSIDNLTLQSEHHHEDHQKLEAELRVQYQTLDSTLHAMQQRQAVHEVRPFHDGAQVLIDSLQASVLRLDSARAVSQGVEDAVLNYKASTVENRKWLIGLAVTAVISTMTIIAWVTIQIIAPVVEKVH